VNDQDQGDVDRALRDHAARWRQAQPAPAPVDVRRLTRPRLPRWVPVVAAAAAVAAVTAGVFLGTGSGPSTARPEATPTPQRNQNAVIPWLPLPPSMTPIPSTTSPPSPDPALARALPACRADQLTPKVGQDGIGGQALDLITLRAAHGTACRIEGRPQVTALGSHGEVKVPAEATSFGADYQEPVRVAGTARAVIILGVPPADCPAGRRDIGLRLRLPGGGGVIEIRGGWPTCYQYGYPGMGKASIGLGSFRPEAFDPARVGTVFATVTAEIPEESVHVDQAGRVSFVVVLTPGASADVPLESCPNYTVALALFTGHAQESHALNCAAVPYRDAAGKPYLPAGSTVRFAMRVPIPAGSSGIAKLVWQLQTPDNVAAGGAVTVP